jgi:hypothetical protein
MKPPRPLEVAERIIGDVNRAVKLDHTSAYEPPREGLRVPDEEYIWPRAEQIAGKAPRGILGEQIEEQCRGQLGTCARRGELRSMSRVVTHLFGSTHAPVL